MSVLSDRDIRAALEAGTVTIQPYDPEDLQPSSVDLHLDRRFRVFRNHGMRIGQISFFQMSSPVDRPYGSKELRSRYQGQKEPTASAFHQDYTKD